MQIGQFNKLQTMIFDLSVILKANTRHFGLFGPASDGGRPSQTYTETQYLKQIWNVNQK